VDLGFFLPQLVAEFVDALEEADIFLDEERLAFGVDVFQDFD
jgi:hypothetical protein